MSEGARERARVRGPGRSECPVGPRALPPPVPSGPAAGSCPLPELSVPRRPLWDPDLGRCSRRGGSGDARRVLSGSGVPVPLAPVSRLEGGLWHWLGTAVLRTSHFILGANAFLFTGRNPFEQRGNCFRLYIADSFKIQC